MKKAFLISALMAGLALVGGKLAHAGMPVVYGGVAVASHTYTAMASTTAADGAYGWQICNESSTGTIRCGYDVNVSTVAWATYLGFAIPARPDAYHSSCAYRAVSVMVYCKSEVPAQTTPATIEVFK